MSLTPNDRLVRMANQIATFFRPYSEQEGVAGVHKHLEAFWSPKMRRDLVAYAPQVTDRLNPLVIKALAETPQAESPVRPAARDPQRAGEGASDAG